MGCESASPGCCGPSLSSCSSERTGAEGGRAVLLLLLCAAGLCENIRLFWLLLNPSHCPGAL